MNTTKDCPFCREEIQAVAKKCKHCGEWLDKTSNAPVLNYHPNAQVREGTIPGRSYLNAAVLTLILYVIGFWFIGAIVNNAYLKSAKRVELETGVEPEGKGCL